MSLWVGQWANDDDEVLMSWFSWHFPVFSRFRNFRMMMTLYCVKRYLHVVSEWVSCHDPQKRNPRPNILAHPRHHQGSGFKMKNFPLPILKVHEILHSWGGDKFTLFIQSCKNPRRWLRGSAMIYLMEVTKVKVCKAAGGQRRHNVRRINLVSRSALWTQNFVFSILNLCKGPKSMMMKMIKWFTPPSKYTACTWYFDHCSSGNWP